MEKNVALVDVKKIIVEKINEKYGSVGAFAETEKGKSLGKNLKTYLYPSGAISYPVLAKLCDHFGIGKLQRKTIVKRTINYSIVAKLPRTTKMSL